MPAGHTGGIVMAMIPIPRVIRRRIEAHYGAIIPGLGKIPPHARIDTDTRRIVKEE